jgi:hypothetical protein
MIETANDAAAAESFTAAARGTVSGTACQLFDQSRSRATTEAMLATKAAADVETRTIMGRMKRVRNMDICDLNDSLDNALKAATNDVAQTLKLITGSPKTKRTRAVTSIQTLIKAALEEIKLLKEINSDGTLDAEMKKAMDNLHDLYNQRDEMKTAATQLSDALE